MSDTTTVKAVKTGGKKYNTLLECVQALKEMGALSVSVSSEKIEATFPQPTLHVEPITKAEIAKEEMLLGYPKDLLLAST